MKTPPNNKALESAPDKANYTKINRVAAVLNRIIAMGILIALYWLCWPCCCACCCGVRYE